MEQFIDGQACRVFDTTMKAWHGDGPRPTWDSITEEQRQAYRDYAARLPFRTHDPALSERFTPT